MDWSLVVRRSSSGLSALGLILLAFASIEHILPGSWPRMLLVAGMFCTIAAVGLRRVANRLVRDAATVEAGKSREIQ
jgi:hypothetical protein